MQVQLQVLCIWKPLVTVTCVQTTAAVFVMFYVKIQNSSAGLLVEFQQHVTDFYVSGRLAPISHPSSFRANVEGACAACCKPPTDLTARSTASISEDIIVAVWSTEHVPVGVSYRIQSPCYGITGVSAVPGHHQSILTGPITDSSRKMTYLGHFYMQP